jgi:hypothetical protein
MKKQLITVILLVLAVNVFAQIRSFNDIFPGVSQRIRNSIFSEEGYVSFSQRSTEFNILGNRQGSSLDPGIINDVLQRNPGYIVEAVSVIPGAPGSVGLIDIYNALQNIRDLEGRLYDSATRGRPIPLFENATRIAGERQNTPVPDPPLSRTIPRTETVFIRLKDANFGNTFYRGEMTQLQNGIRYTMTNTRNMSYLFVPIIREGNFIAQLYFEPIQEGVLIYSIAGADLSDFFAARIHISSAISKRLAVITSWATDGIKRNTR